MMIMCFSCLKFICLLSLLPFSAHTLQTFSHHRPVSLFVVHLSVATSDVGAVTLPLLLQLLMPTPSPCSTVLLDIHEFGGLQACCVAQDRICQALLLFQEVAGEPISMRELVDHCHKFIDTNAPDTSRFNVMREDLLQCQCYSMLVRVTFADAADGQFSSSLCVLLTIPALLFLHSLILHSSKQQAVSEQSMMVMMMVVVVSNEKRLSPSLSHKRYAAVPLSHCEHLAVLPFS